MADNLVTIGEFVVGTNPPIDDERMTALVLILGVEPVDRRHTGQAGRPRRLFRRRDLAELHRAASPWLRRLGEDSAVASIAAGRTGATRAAG
jgi:hypothetical protein